MTTEACTFSVGVIHAGQWVNCVSSRADAEVLTMAKRQEDLDAGVQKMLSLASSGDVVFDVRRGVTRPVWEVDQRGLELCAMAEDFHKQGRHAVLSLELRRGALTAISPARWASPRSTVSASKAR